MLCNDSPEPGFAAPAHPEPRAVFLVILKSASVLPYWQEYRY